MPHSLILISLLIIGCGTKDDTPDAEWEDDETADGWDDGSTGGGGSGTDDDGSGTGGGTSDGGDTAGTDDDSDGDADGIGADGTTDEDADADGGSVSVDATLVITSPEYGAEFTDSRVNVSFEVVGCDMSSPADNPGGCHIHRSVNGVAYSDGDDGQGHYSSDPMVLELGADGGKNIRLELFRNDGSDLPFEPTISDTVSVIVWTPADTGTSDVDGDEDTGGDDGDGDDDGDDDGDGDDGGDADADDGGDGGGEPASECTLDALDFAVRVEDGDGPCGSPCDADDVLTYYASVTNETSVDCFIETSSSCLVRDIEIIVSGPHGGTIATHWPSCDDAITEHIIPAGGSVEESVEGGRLDYGVYVVQANFDVESSLAYGTTNITVD
jgi:hypothetical protein